MTFPKIPINHPTLKKQVVKTSTVKKNKSPKTNDPLEKDIEMACCHYFKSIGFFLFKVVQNGYYDAVKKRFRKHVSPYCVAGISDIIIVHQGSSYYVEFKRRLGRASEEQKSFCEAIRKQKCHYWICRSLDEARVIAKAIHQISLKNNPA